MIKRSSQLKLPTSQSKENLQGIYPLEPTQEAFLWLRENTNIDPGVLVAEATLGGELDSEVFESAWNEEVKRHEMLRSSIRSRSGRQSMLVVWKQVQQPVSIVDVSESNDLDSNRKISELRERLMEDVSPEQLPSSSLAIVKLGADRHVLMWAFHHLFLDGWSTSIVIRNVLARYGAILGGRTLKSQVKPSYGEYIQTLRRSDIQSREYWEATFDGFAGMKKLAITNASIEKSNRQTETRRLGEVPSQELMTWLKNAKLSSSSLIAATWSIIVKSLWSQSDIAFGMTASGRGLPLDGISEFVGLLSNAVPFRVPPNDDVNLREWLNAIREQQFEMQSHENCSLGEIDEWCSVSSGRSICESLLVVENFPLEYGDQSSGSLALMDYRSGATSSFPLTCYVVPGQDWVVKLEYESEVVSLETAQQIASQFASLLLKFGETSLESPARDFQNFGEFSPAEPLSFMELVRDHKTHGNLDLHLQAPSEVELKLASIWESVLGLPSIGFEEGFFELGGKSIAAVRMLASVEKEYGVRFAPTVLIESPTIRQLATRITDGREPSPESIVRFNRHTQGDPVVCLHVGGGYSTYFRFLAKHFGDIPVVGMQPRGLQEGEPINSFPELASYFIEQLDQVFGPRRYRLVGYCMSAALALEMAHQLDSLNRPARSLTMIDSGLNWGNRLVELKNFVRAEKSFWVGSRQYLKSTFFKILRTIRKKMERPVPNQLEGEALARELQRKRVESACLNAFQEFEPHTTDVPIKLIRSSQYKSMLEKSFHLEWVEFTTAEFSVDVVDAEHERILFDPTAAILAKLILASES